MDCGTSLDHRDVRIWAEKFYSQTMHALKATSTLNDGHKALSAFSEDNWQKLLNSIDRTNGWKLRAQGVDGAAFAASISWLTLATIGMTLVVA